MQQNESTSLLLGTELACSFQFRFYLKDDELSLALVVLVSTVKIVMVLILRGSFHCPETGDKFYFHCAVGGWWRVEV